MASARNNLLLPAFVMLGALAAGPALAAPVEMRITQPAGNVQFSYFFSGPDVYLDYQRDFQAAQFAASPTWDFRFRYDPTLGGDYGFEFVSGQFGSFTDFSLFTPTMRYFANSGFSFQLSRRDQITGTLSYTTDVFLRFQDTNGYFGATPPSSFDVSQLNSVQLNFETRRAGGVGTGWRIARIGQSSAEFFPVGSNGDGPGPGQQPIGAVPEPASWAMLIAGFGLVGARLRRRRVQLA